jgi:hypothetical protein
VASITSVLDTRLGNQSHLPRVGDDYPPDMRRDSLGHRRSVASRLDDDMVIVR